MGVGRRQPRSSTRRNCAALVTTHPEAGSLKGRAAAHQQYFPSCFKKCVFPTVKESGACCPDKGRSSRRGQAVSLPRAAKCPQCVWDYCNPLGFSCSSSGYKAPASQLATLWKTTASQVLIIPLPVCALLLPVL